jgi:hypothetical protein
MSLARVVLASLFLALAGSARASAVDELLGQYRAQSGKDFSAAAGEQLWEHQFPSPEGGEPRRCALCHTANLKNVGKHAVTGKRIEPLAPSVNAERLADKAKIEKWLDRNCKWTIGRACTPQEKGDVLTMIRNR